MHEHTVIFPQYEAVSHPKAPVTCAPPVRLKIRLHSRLSGRTKVPCGRLAVEQGFCARSPHYKERQNGWHIRTEKKVIFF